MVKEQIIYLYYEEHTKVKDIANKLHISSAYITKIIKLNENYAEEKEFRKSISKQKRKISQNLFIKNKRDKARIEDNYYAMQEQHRQASVELSGSKHLSNENYRKWNCSAYKYNPSKHRYEFREELGRSADVPKYINGR